MRESLVLTTAGRDYRLARMPDASITVLVLALLATSSTHAILFVRRRRELTRNNALSPSLRELLTQHWIRGALLSEPGERWRSICSALAVLAATAPTYAELARVLSEAREHCRDETDRHVLDAAIGELHAARNGQGPAVVAPEDWPWPVLLNRGRAELWRALGITSEHDSPRNTPHELDLPPAPH